MLGNEALAGELIGTLGVFADIGFAGGDEEPADVSGSGDSGGGPRANGPDVIVGGLGVSGFNGSNPTDVVSFSTTPPGPIKAFSLATTSCNIGTDELDWIDCQQSGNPACARHPVISQNMFRLKNGRFEQLGQSWLKHGFCALDEELCTSNCPNGTCDTLGVGCSDPYTASRNSGPGLGRKSEVNAFTGVFPYPFTNGSGSSPPITGRLQVRVDDINPSLNAGAQYWVESQYTAQDDAAAGNADNNASYRAIQFTPSMGITFPIPTTAGTITELPAIRAWSAADPSVVQTNVRVPNEGLMILAAKASDNGNGTWHYEYALFNQNSDRSARSFSVPVAGATLSNIGFHDVDYHSGEPYSLTDWTALTEDGVLTWSTQTFSQNVNANALRWGTMYNFRFDADIPPAEEHAEVTIGLFKPGAGSSVAALTIVPNPIALGLELSGPAPTLVLPACRSTSFDVTIAPGSQTLADGTASLHYRYDGGPFQTASLELVSGELHRATLPPPPCSATAEFYVSAQGHLGETVTLPDTAPAVVFNPDVGTPVTTDVIAADFEGGLPATWTATGLWNATASCPVTPANCSGGQFAYFGNPATCTYDTGVSENGDLSVEFAIPETFDAKLEYCSNFQREQFVISDWPSVKINGINVDQPALGGLGSSVWVQRTVDLTAYAGQTVTLTFNFNTTDHNFNNYRGWQIDNVRVTAVQVQCNAASPVIPGDLDGNSLVNGSDVSAFIAAALEASTSPEHVCPGDFNADGVLDHLDVDGLVNSLLN
ncbi:MAG TPA: hypothetical protein VNT79_08290 [Phycisphaerae bacterium]|nr:hypothetical protein [Phycisphaerae bacterium]